MGPKLIAFDEDARRDHRSRRRLVEPRDEPVFELARLLAVLPLPCEGGQEPTRDERAHCCDHERVSQRRSRPREA